MSKANFHNHETPSALSDEEISKIVSQRLPRWKAACDNAEADTVVFNHRAFGHSLDETFLLACAIRYAQAKRNVSSREWPNARWLKTTVSASALSQAAFQRGNR